MRDLFCFKAASCDLRGVCHTHTRSQLGEFLSPTNNLSLEKIFVVARKKSVGVWECFVEVWEIFWECGKILWKCGKILWEVCFWADNGLTNTVLVSQLKNFEICILCFGKNVDYINRILFICKKIF